jgi:hypothetical protein
MTSVVDLRWSAFSRCSTPKIVGLRLFSSSLFYARIHGTLRPRFSTIRADVAVNAYPGDRYVPLFPHSLDKLIVVHPKGASQNPQFLTVVKILVLWIGSKPTVGSGLMNTESQ